MEASKHQATDTNLTTNHDLTTRRKSDCFSAATGKGIVSFEEDKVQANDKSNVQNKLRNHSQGSLGKGLEVIVPLKFNSTKDQQVSFDTDKNSNSSPHMVSNSYILTASEDENEPDTVDSGGYFSRKATTSSRKLSFERRGTVNTIATNTDEDDSDEQTHHINFTHDAFDK